MGVAMTASDDGARVVVKGFALGDYGTHSYVVRLSEAGEAGRLSRRCWIVDCGDRPGAVLSHLSQEGLTPETVVLTHAHWDHIAGLFELRAAFPACRIIIHEAESAWLDDPLLNLSELAPRIVTAPPADEVLRGAGGEIELCGRRWRWLHTPGHSPGGVSLLDAAAERATMVFGGDCLFQGSIGRTDLPGGDAAELERSVRRLYRELADSVVVFPGHGPRTTIGAEKAGNPYVRPE